MYIRSIEIQGMTDLPYCRLTEIPSKGMRFEQATPETTALADAIAMWFSAFDEVTLVDLIVQWGWAQEEDIEVFGEERVEEIQWFDGACASMWVEERDVSISLDLVLDAGTLQQMRQLISNPEVQVALMTDPVFVATVSLRWSNDHQVMGIGLSGVQLGQWRMPVEKPHWYAGLLQLLKMRFFRNHNRFAVAEAALSTMLSLNGFERYSAFQDACSEWGKLRVASLLDREPVLLIDDRPIRRWGDDMEANIRVLASWHLIESDIVWSDRLLGNAPSTKQIWGVDSTSEDAVGGRALNLRAQDTTIQFPQGEH